MKLLLPIFGLIVIVAGASMARASVTIPGIIIGCGLIVLAEFCRTKKSREE
jgi:hypothetical protein